MPPIVTITTDFGHSDSYVAAMKGRLLTYLPDCHLIDVTHDVPLGDVMRGALAVRDVAPYFPPGTIHLVVVDPGVGSNRRPIIVQTPRLKAVGPDNGVLSVLWEGEGGRCSFFQIDPAVVASGQISGTFHGRDLFAPAAALLASGAPAERLGSPIGDPVELELPAPTREPYGLIGEILYHDNFGNLVTNIRRDHLPGDPEGLLVEIAGRVVRGLVRSYSQGGGGLVALIGSTGLLEVALPGGSAYTHLGVEFGTKVRVSAIERLPTTRR